MVAYFHCHPSPKLFQILCDRFVKSSPWPATFASFLFSRIDLCPLILSLKRTRGETLIKQTVSAMVRRTTKLYFAKSRIEVGVGIAHQTRTASTNCSSVNSPWTNFSKRSRCISGVRPSRRRSATAWSTALRRRRTSKTVIALDAGAAVIVFGSIVFEIHVSQVLMHALLKWFEDSPLRYLCIERSPFR